LPPLLAQKKNRKKTGIMGNKHHRENHSYFWKGCNASYRYIKMRTIIRLPNSTFFDIEIVNKDLPDKAKPSARRGRKAADL